MLLINWYENGRHYIGAHSDNVNPLVDNSPIVSISIGATRIFRIKDKKTRSIVKDITVKHGTVVVMGGLNC